MFVPNNNTIIATFLENLTFNTTMVIPFQYPDIISVFLFCFCCFVFLTYSSEKLLSGECGDL